MIPANVRLLETAAQELRAVHTADSKAFIAVCGALTQLGRKGPPEGTRRFPITLPSDDKAIELLIFGFDTAGYRVLFEGERIVMRSKEGWDLVRGIPRAGEGFVYTVWAILRV